MGGPLQPDYLNAVLRVETDGTARDLLEAARRVESALGRVRAERWGARTIDVDVLLFGEERIEEPDLIVPHPRMTHRAFVVVPLLELDADPPMPEGGSLTEVRLDTDGIAPVAPPLEVGG